MAETSAVREPSAGASPSIGRQGPMLVVLLSAWFMAQFDFFVVNVAAPSLQRELGAGPAALQLIVGGFIFAYSGGGINRGRTRFDRGPGARRAPGHRRPLRAGLADHLPHQPPRRRGRGGPRSTAAAP